MQKKPPVQFCLTTVKIIRRPKELRVILPERLPILTTKDDYKSFSDPKNAFARQGLWRWAAGGLLLLYVQGNKTFIPLIKRDSGAPNYPGHLTLSSGLSISREEFFNPLLTAIREGFEEVACLVNGRIVEPHFGSCCCCFPQQAISAIVEKQRARVERFGIRVSPLTLPCPAHFVSTAGESLLTVEQGKRVSSYSGIVSIDQATRGVDLLKVVQVSLPPGEIRFADCEETDNGPLDRKICLFSLGSFRSFYFKVARSRKSPMRADLSGSALYFKGGVARKGNAKTWHPCTPVLATLVEEVLGRR